MLCSLLLPPLVIGLLLVFLVGPYTPIGELIGHLHLSATNTFLALVHRRGLRVRAVLRGRRAGRVRRGGPAAGAAGAVARRPAAAGLPPGHAAAGRAGSGHGPGGGLGPGHGRVRRGGHHRLPPVRAYRCRSTPRCRRPGWPPRCRSPWSCWSWRCRCRWPPTSGAPVLEADVEVDRRDFTVRAAVQVAAGERVALFGPSGAGKTTLLEVVAGLVAPRRRPGGTRRPGAHLDRPAGAGRCRRGSAGSACSARIPACSRTCPCAAT